MMPGTDKKFYKDIYYIDGCYRKECLMLMDRYGELLINDGISKFGFGRHKSQDEIMLGKYNMVLIYSRELSGYKNFYKEHKIEKVYRLMTTWDTFTKEIPGQSERFVCDGKTVYDLPDELQEWGIYLVGTR